MEDTEKLYVGSQIDYLWAVGDRENGIHLSLVAYSCKLLLCFLAFWKGGWALNLRVYVHWSFPRCI